MKRTLFLLLLAVTGFAQPAHKAPLHAVKPAVKPVRTNALAARVEKLFAESSVARNAFWGVEAVNLATGKTIFELNQDRFFVPASNTKLFSTSLALTRLGPDYTFQTRVTAESGPDADGRIAGAVRLVGGGDPNLSARAIPYHPGPVQGDALAPLADLAAQVAAKGVRRIDGDIVGDDSWYVFEPFGNGWSIDDPVFDYGAPVSALTLNDNAFTLNIRPGAAEGDAAALTLNPAVEFYAIDNRILTVAAGGERRIHYSRAAGSMALKLWGTIPIGNRGEDLSLGIEDPALYAAIVFRQALEAHGITVGGRAVARHVYPNEVADLKQAPAAAADTAADPAIELASRKSAPLMEDLRITAKVSQNLHAELDLRAVGRARRNIGSVEAGLEELKAFLTEAGIESSGYNINDGSGLARPNLVSPATVVKLLRYMYASPLRDSFLSILPVGGQDGTLGSRFTDAGLAGRIHAKTGSLAHVSALSGYAQRPNGEWVVFSILVNNFNGPTGEVRAVMDKICALLAE